MKKFILFSILFLFTISSFATHNRAGEITYRWLGGNTYEVTITTYTKNSVPADRCELTIDWGDTTTQSLPRSNGASSSACPANARIGELIPGTDIRKNIYIGTHTYGASGIYLVSFEDPNRNLGISNIVQSVNVPFYVQTELVVSSTLGGNNSVQLLNPPINDGCTRRIFKHNPGAFDIDGDSLSYQLVLSRGSDGIPISTIYDPAFVTDSIKINEITGDLIWDVPQQIGQFNFAIQINEWRKDPISGQPTRIGYVTRDLQVDIKSCANQPPVISPVGPFCIEAGKTLTFNVSASDPDGDRINLSAFGGPFNVTNPAQAINTTGPSPRTATFVWQTECSHVRKQSYFVSFVAEDIPVQFGEQALVDIYTTEITVVAPSPKNPIAVATGQTINLNWDPSICTEAIGYRIYRKEDSFGFFPSDCETGVPDYTGYEFLAEVQGLNSLSYSDDFELKKGVRYCYMVYAFFEDESESYASVEFCASLPLTDPLMTNVDILSTDQNNGNISIHWVHPPQIDSTMFPPPYSFKLYRSIGLEELNFTEIQSLNDTFYIDQGLNTLDSSYRYKVEMFSGVNSDFAGDSDPASSIYLKVEGRDESNFLEFTHNTPWQNYEYIISRESPTGSGVFINIDTVNTHDYLDENLVNGDLYCYKVQGIGEYSAGDTLLPKPLLNNSQINCASPIDTSAPCPPVLIQDFYCESDSLVLNWLVPANLNCENDAKVFNLYYKESESESFPSTPILQFNSNQNSHTLIAVNDGRPIVGCYAITAVDDADLDPAGQANESDFSNIICVQSCPLIKFPNMFSPNGDLINDFFSATEFKDIKELRISIRNRWGTEVYQTNDGNQFLNQGWDGKDSFTGQDCSEGVYYFICQYSPLSITESRERVVKGFVHLFR
tara:strand:- start:141475 stop:144147 length:2673 start_codon:yes stop_codon:yes gene_type:complete